MKTIHLVSPGHSTSRSNYFHAGRRSMELSKLGINQANGLADRFIQGLPVNREMRIISSSDRRCLAMAGILAERIGSLPKIVNSLMAIDLGDWDSLRQDEIEAADGIRFEHWLSDENFPAPGGESIGDVARRIWPDFVHEVESCDENEDLLVFAPSIILALIACHILNMPITSAHQLKLNPASTSSFCLASLGFYQMGAWNRLWSAAPAVLLSAPMDATHADLEPEPVPM